MNHLGDTNKMVDTPRTDELLTAMLDVYGYVHQGNCPQQWVNYARELEGELNAANERIQSLIQERDRANRLAEWKWNLRDEFQLLLGTDKIEEGIEAVKELKRRIQQLEEAVEAYRTAYTPDGHVSPHDCFATGPKTGNPFQDLFACPGCLAERKAKEAKP